MIFRIPESSGLATIILLGIVAAAHAVALPSFLAGGLDSLQRAEPGVPAVLYLLARLGAFLITIAASITWIVWAVQSRKNVEAAGAVDLDYSTWFPWYFVVPFLNLFVPMLAVQEIWRKSVPRAPDGTAPAARSSKLVFLWWAFFAVYVLAGFVPGLVDGASGTTLERDFLPVYHGAAVFAAVLGAIVVGRLIARQRRLGSTLGLSSSGQRTVAVT